MTIFKHRESGRLYTITRNLVGPCVCGQCCGKYTATEYPRGMFPSSFEVRSLDDFEKVGVQ